MNSGPGECELLGVTAWPGAISQADFVSLSLTCLPFLFKGVTTLHTTCYCAYSLFFASKKFKKAGVILRCLLLFITVKHSIKIMTFFSFMLPCLS